MNDEPGFVAVLLSDQDPQADRTIPLPKPHAFPPMRVQLPGDLGGAATYDVFELIDSSEWPEQAVYRYTATVPRTTLIGEEA
ncbi:hypothetical protein ACF1AJ_11215 [Leifsonia sp. NPDC014704]|uniref:hypothetical protein n=1 Tax=Leifsonia sp. NPDC014704 TaxID=3364123 RepID=UPI0036F4AB6F